jgi:ferredoxin-NADP reductase
LIFVAVADAAQSVGAAEAEAFFDLLHQHDWARCPALAGSLKDAERKYPEHWRQYIAGGIGRAVPAVTQAVRRVAARLSPEHGVLLEGDLLHIADVLRRAAKRERLPRSATPEQPFAALEAALRAASPSGAAAEPALPQPTPADAPHATLDGEAALIARAEPWKSVRALLRCVRVTAETADVKTFHFSSDEARPFGYKPGQFITIDLELYGKKVRRNYTITSSPSRPHLIALTIKRIAGGVASNWLHDHLAVGDTLRAVVANGKFHCWDIRENKVLMLSAGIGITPVMSMARWQSDLCLERDTVFFHSARTPADIVFRRELELLQGPGFKLIVNCTRLAPDQEWSGLRGRLDAAMLHSAVPDFMERVVFMCGPDAWMNPMREFLGAAGYPMENLHVESFGARSRGAPAARPLASPVAGTRIVFARSNKEVACGTDEPILEVAERSGIDIANSCRVGACGTCKARKVSGVVNHVFTPGLGEADAAQGYVLTCSSTVEGTVVIDA